MKEKTKDLLLEILVICFLSIWAAMILISIAICVMFILLEFNYIDIQLIERTICILPLLLMLLMVTWGTLSILNSDIFNS
jgi:hypothetical protein